MSAVKVHTNDKKKWENLCSHQRWGFKDHAVDVTVASPYGCIELWMKLKRYIVDGRQRHHHHIWSRGAKNKSNKNQRTYDERMMNMQKRLTLCLSPRVRKCFTAYDIKFIAATLFAPQLLLLVYVVFVLLGLLHKVSSMRSVNKPIHSKKFCNPAVIVFLRLAIYNLTQWNTSANYIVPLAKLYALINHFTFRKVWSQLNANWLIRSIKVAAWLVWRRRRRQSSSLFHSLAYAHSSVVSEKCYQN